MREPKPIFKCPECNSEFTSNAIMAMHRKNKHGVEGVSKSSLDLKKQELQKVLGKYQCPECGRGFGKNGNMQRHFKAVHEIALQVLQPTPEFKCSDCEFVGKNKHGLAIHRIVHTRSKGVALEPTPASLPSIPTPANGHREANGHVAANGIPEATLAVALGRFQGLCQSMANEFDLPPRMFTAQLAVLIYRSTLR